MQFMITSVHHSRKRQDRAIKSLSLNFGRRTMFKKEGENEGILMLKTS